MYLPQGYIFDQYEPALRYCQGLKQVSGCWMLDITDRRSAHGSRLTAHGARLTAHGSRRMAQGAWLTAHGARRTAHGARFRDEGIRSKAEFIGLRPVLFAMRYALCARPCLPSHLLPSFSPFRIPPSDFRIPLPFSAFQLPNSHICLAIIINTSIIYPLYD